MARAGNTHVAARLVLPLAAGEVVMTLPPERIGDKGQRYEIWYTDSAGVEKRFGWTDTQGGIKIMLRGISLHPSMHAGRVIDRRPGTPKRKAGGQRGRTETRAK